MDQINNDFAATKDLISSFTINISYIIRVLRAKAQAVGIDLSRPFFFPPDDPQFNQILSQIRRERDARIARLRRDKKKFAAAKARGRGENITELPRVRDLNYPTVMREIFTATSSAR